MGILVTLVCIGMSLSWINLIILFIYYPLDFFNAMIITSVPTLHTPTLLYQVYGNLLPRYEVRYNCNNSTCFYAYISI